MYTLLDGIVQNAKHPDTFEIPTHEEKQALGKHDYVKLCFENSIGYPERMWVNITERNGSNFVGVLHNDPLQVAGLRYLDVIEFEERHIISIL